MKKNLQTILSAAALLLAVNSYGQNSLSEFAPVVANPQSSPLPTTNALWDVQFNYDLTAAIGANGNAGVVFNGTTFWVSKWASADINELDSTGAVINGGPFQVTNVTGVRALTYDGTSIYASQNTATISVIDPSSYMETSTIDISALGFNARSLCYDATANGGLGGLWVSNYGTDIVLIDLAGNTLNTIPAATHTLTGMYGTAFDNVTPGGPYLWVFDQPTTIYQIDIATGTPTGITHDITTDIGSGLTSSLAGGISFSTHFSPYGSLIGVNQGNPTNQLFGYNLGGPSGINDLGSAFTPSLNVYPNPATDLINVDLKNLAAAKYAITVYDITGKAVLSTSVNKTKSTINVTSLANGFYTIKATSDKQTVINKFKIQR